MIVIKTKLFRMTKGFVLVRHWSHLLLPCCNLVAIRCFCRLSFCHCLWPWHSRKWYELLNQASLCVTFFFFNYTCTLAAANPYITSLGSPKFASFRINAAQAFNGVGTFIAPLIASKAFFGGTDDSTASTFDRLGSVKWAYVGIGCGMNFLCFPTNNVGHTLTYCCWVVQASSSLDYVSVWQLSLKSIWKPKSWKIVVKKGELPSCLHTTFSALLLSSCTPAHKFHWLVSSSISERTLASLHKPKAPSICRMVKLHSPSDALLVHF